MSDLVQFYLQQAQEGLSTIPWLATKQQEALKQFERAGFPSRHHEEWKYTSVDALVKQLFQAKLPSPVEQTVRADIPLAPHVLIHNGHVFLQRELLAQLPKGLIIMPLAQALTEHADLVQPHLAHILAAEHGFHALNTALIHSGVFLYIPEGMRIETPIVLHHYQDKAQHAVHLRHLIRVASGGDATVVEHYQGFEEVSYFTNSVTEVALEARARLTHYKVQRESRKAYHLGHIAVQQKAHSHFASHSLNLGAALARSDMTIALLEEQASCLMNGIYAPTDGQHVDHHTTVNHLVPNCDSEQDYKGILKGKARAVFNGKVKVARDAQHTLAKQQNKNLLLSASAEVNTKPQLEIFADDVVCSHGATVGQLDEEALFYLATRGIDRIEAAQYLIHAFAENNLRLIPNRTLSDWMSQLLTQQLG